jgi:hypothetical protein
MAAGRPTKVDPGTLYSFAHQFYWDLRRIGEGSYRWRRNEKKYQRLLAEIGNVQITDAQKSHLQGYVDEEIQSGRMKEAEKRRCLRRLEQDQLDSTREWLRGEAAHEALEQLKIPGEPDVLEALLRAQSPQVVRTICEDASMPVEVKSDQGHVRTLDLPTWPISMGSVLPMYLTRHAAEFIATKLDRRFPRSGRPSSRLKQLWFLSRALAGAIFGMKARTAINIVGSKRPEQMFEESRAAKPLRRKRKK